MNRNPPQRAKVAICIPSTDTWKARTATVVAMLCGHSATSGIELVLLNAEGSMISSSRNVLVEAALTHGCDYLFWIDTDMVFPPDALVRLLARRKDIIAANYNKKRSPYDPIGQLEDPPNVETDGLQEALALPSGMMLVKADVYRKLGWPAYFETACWAGQGVEGFKEMLRCSFSSEPPAAVLGSIDASPLGVWLQANYRVDERGDRYKVWSEDFAFCRKARRHGYAIWCDLELTEEMIHLGTQEIKSPAPAQSEAPN
jgi:hypothetical protein